MRESRESEQIVLASLMHDRTVLDELETTARDFYAPEHEALYQIITTEIRGDNPADPASIVQRLHSDPVPGLTPAYLHTVYSSLGTPREGIQHARIVAGLAQLRRIQQAGVALQQSTETADWDMAAKVLDDAKKTIDDAESTTTNQPVRTFQQALLDAMNIWSSPTERETTETGWEELDEVLNGGWRPGQLTILGARPAVGKSVIAACAAVQVAESKGVSFFSLEMDEHEVVNRMTANLTHIYLSQLEQEALEPHDWDKVHDLANSGYGRHLFLHSEPRTSTLKVRSKIRKDSQFEKPSLIVVDYLQLMEPARKSDSRERQVSQLAEDLKIIARETSSHVLALAQVNRDAAERPPLMSDLRESGGIEAHADNVVLLHRDDDEKPGEIQMRVEKNRHGPTRAVNLSWRPHFSKATDM